MNKTWKRQVFRHTALYTAILMFSHTGGGGQAQAQTHKYAIVMNNQKLPEVKWGNDYSSLTDKSNEREVTHTSKFVVAKKHISFSFNNTDEVVAEKKDAVVFGAATYLPPYGKVSGFDTAKLAERKNALDQIGTTHPGLIGYNYQDVTCASGNCPELSYRTQFTFNNGLKRNGNGGRLDIYEDKSRDSSPIYKLKDYPWLGVSFNLGGESSFKLKRQGSLVSSFSEDVTQQNGTQDQYKSKNLVYTTDDYNSKGNKNHQDKHHAVAFYLNAKLHLLDKKQIKNIAQGVTVDLGTLKTRIEPTDAWKNRQGSYFNNGTWTYEEKGSVSVKLKLPEVKAGRCITTPNPNPKSKAPSPALTAPALWFGPVQNGKVQMYSASVSTYPDSSSSRIYLQNLKRKDDPGRPGRYSLATLNKSDIESREPTFTGRQTVIRLDKGVHQIKLKGNEVEGFKGNNGNDTFGIVSEGSFMPDASEWKKVLLPWTVRGVNDDQFKTFNQEAKDGKPKYSQKYRSRDNNKGERNLGDIVNSPIVAVGGYLATSANDGMVHIFKKGNGGDERNYSLKLSYIPGTMPRKDIESQDSTLAKELRAFAEKGYVGDRYGVDGGFVLRQVNNLNGQDRVFMFGAMGFGGRGAYALDLTKADGNDPTKASLFDVKDNGNNGNNGNNRVELGYTVGTPQIGKTHNGKYAAFLASGYATKEITSGENKTALYVYDLENNNGTPIAKIEVPNGKGGLSSPTLVDKDLDGTVDIAYAGDRGGNMYRFDLSSDNPSSWTVRTIFQGTKPITSAPAISQLKDKRVVIFGTGSDLSEEDVDNNDIQSIYGIFDNDTDTGFAQDGLGKGLLEQKLSEENKTLFLTDYKRSDGSGSKGWVVKLKDGQRVTVKPTVVLRTAFVTIHKYTGTDKCGAETAILGINTADGGKLTKKSARPIVPAANSKVAQYSGDKKTANGKSIPIGCMEKGNETVCPNGYVYDKPVNVRYLDEKKIDGFSTTADGDAGGSGIDPAGKRSGKNNRCFSQKGVRTLLMNDLDSLDITGPTCGMKRISWREIFY
ncbi:pilus assembly protein [Neisseria meningitidis]|uniref:PilC family type IV pilus tip adhesin n=1 Tax=Neisseria meningitidis TaxID=487 RepID=UPI0011F2A861|nr:PilC family type IV pilus tip adhesin [Neisseria meningitidis]QEN84258.1 pilus assembly protein [Neisseria meningitidis]